MAESNSFCYLCRARGKALGRVGRAGLSGRRGPSNSNPQAGPILVSTQGSTSPSKPLTRAEQEVHSAAERLNSQTDDALAAVAARSNPGGVEELEGCAERLERAARDLAVALRELVEERREKDKQL